MSQSRISKFKNYILNTKKKEKISEYFEKQKRVVEEQIALKENEVKKLEFIQKDLFTKFQIQNKEQENVLHLLKDSYLTKQQKNQNLHYKIFSSNKIDSSTNTNKTSKSFNY